MPAQSGGTGRMRGNRHEHARRFLLPFGVCAALAQQPARAQETAQPFTLACVNTGGKTIYFSIDLPARRWALMKANGALDSKPQAVAAESSDIIKLKNPGGYFNIDRKTGAMELIKGETRRVDRIPCAKHETHLPIPADVPAANKF
ncbi:hypothetical protein [Methylobacterium sp. Leaf87]|uniref:hypothetical protein n=1 Tax=Methylobacterium sp. Leaf87 TaxID=1736243 RepID=UPI0012E98421|nr:hypothetical protein [Methylobacterium sp. Leaf87]